MNDENSFNFNFYLEKFIQLLSQNRSIEFPYPVPSLNREPNTKWFKYFADKENLAKLIDLAFEQEVIFISKDTFYLMDISKEDYRYNSLVFQIDGTIFKSRETTTTIIKRFTEITKVDYKFVQNLGKSLGINQKCPYVLGDTFFAPDGGVSKKPVNWLGFHQVSYISDLNDGTLLKLGQHNEFYLPTPYKFIMKMKERTSMLASAQKVVFQEWYTLYQKMSLSNSIIDYTLENWKYTKRLPNMIELQHQFMTYKAVEILYRALGEGNPIIDDIKSLD